MMPRRGIRDMASSQLLEIFLIAMVAGVILFRLYTVLGRRTGHERPPQENYRLSERSPCRPATIPPLRTAMRAQLAPPAASERPADPVAGGLLDIQLADRSFDKDHFVTGARAAYEMILTAFANNDRAGLRPLLSDEVYARVRWRRCAGAKSAAKSSTFTFVGFKEVKIVAAALKGQHGRDHLSVSRRSSFPPPRTRKGALIEGDTKTVRDVTDVWTFSRDVRARDPNWTLVATSGELA